MDQRMDRGIDRLVQLLLRKQSQDGSWRLGFIDSGTTTDAAAVMLLTSAGIRKPALVASLCERILAKQGADGAWRVYPDEEGGNLAATAECYFALQFAGLSPSLARMKQARERISELGGLSRIDSLLTKFLLAIVGQYEWPRWFPVPLSLLLLPPSAPLHFYQFSGYARVHMAPMMLLGSVKPTFTLPHIEPLRSHDSDLSLQQLLTQQDSWQQHISMRIPSISGLSPLTALNKLGTARALQYMQRRIEPDGTLYCYASATILMIHALRALEYDIRHPLITKAVSGLETLLIRDDTNLLTTQNTTSTVWDTALISHTLQDAGVNTNHPSIRSAGQYLLKHQHTKLGDWKLNVEHPLPGGWGFSESNTMNPDLDDTTAVLRAIERLAHSAPYREARELGLQWLLSMQNSDGGWAAFERNVNSRLISWVPLDGAEDAATDPSTPDLTGRTLEYLGKHTGLTTSGSHFMRRAADWLYCAQQADGSWYGRWGVCYIYGTWAALTGLIAAGESPNHPQIRKAKEWLHRIQLPDGGFGESCRSDHVKRYIPLSYSTLSQTAWALDALIAISAEPSPAMERACDFLLRASDSENPLPRKYPTGAGLPGYIYTQYESYSHVWPLLALANYRGKFGGGALPAT
ncbi:prenyltransferase/squalene oxidase repeat-containing protein [Paenibacillus sp. CF384]|uniref:terpene cyclase/mutase family protein n=1 Tax=Paenibacillus sp. CF384 TaxID=1884382 RepID=UPI000895456F|nr:prenyltransferase/squalene oxidase repeat-containing protein [Paenibacillus sp. CF384]SDW60741.1 sporulenol synthase [Paenibacillus sp. CF384]